LIAPPSKRGVAPRRYQWILLSEEMPRFTFPPVSSLEQLGVLFKVKQAEKKRDLFLKIRKGLDRFSLKGLLPPTLDNSLCRGRPLP